MNRCIFIYIIISISLHRRLYAALCTARVLCNSDLMLSCVTESNTATVSRYVSQLCPEEAKARAASQNVGMQNFQLSLVTEKPCCSIIIKHLYHMCMHAIVIILSIILCIIIYIIASNIPNQLTIPLVEIILHLYIRTCACLFCQQQYACRFIR